MLGGVPVRRVVAAPDVPAGHAQAEVDPLRTDAQAVLTAVRARGDFSDLIEVGAALQCAPPFAVGPPGIEPGTSRL